VALLATDPVDWKIDRSTWDLIIPLQHVSGAEGVAQRIAIKMKLIRGELFTDQSKGMPWFEGQGVDPDVVILGNPFNEALAKNEARKIIESIEGTDEIESLTATFDNTTRIMTITFRVSTVFGETVEDKLEVQL
jgi:hypothetical protein